MGRKRISEYKAKKIIMEALGLSYSGASLKDTISSHKFAKGVTYVAKVDQGVKKRFKQGLVKLNLSSEDIPKALTEFSTKGYSQFIVEPLVVHDQVDEHYIALERVRDGIKIYFSKVGGVDIESSPESVKTYLIDSLKNIDIVVKQTGLDSNFIATLLRVFEDNYCAFLEINPFVIKNGIVNLLDVACEVDSAGEFFVQGRWTTSDFVEVQLTQKSEEQREIEQLASKSQASFKFDLLNPNGSIFVLLSGGGASVVIADEVYNQGYHKELADYGEYSGNPNGEETYTYTRAILKSLLKSTSKKKVLIIGGGVANFTDIRTTFKGVIKALSELSKDLREQYVKVFVRRGGPNQKEGLGMMEEFLKKEDLFGEVRGPDMVLTNIVLSAISYLKEK